MIARSYKNTHPVLSIIWVIFFRSPPFLSPEKGTFDLATVTDLPLVQGYYPFFHTLPAYTAEIPQKRNLLKIFFRSIALNNRSANRSVIRRICIPDPLGQPGFKRHGEIYVIFDTPVFFDKKKI